jgi:hypothetical protein
MRTHRLSRKPAAVLAIFLSPASSRRSRNRGCRTTLVNGAGRVLTVTHDLFLLFSTLVFLERMWPSLPFFSLPATMGSFPQNCRPVLGDGLEGPGRRSQKKGQTSRVGVARAVMDRGVVAGEGSALEYGQKPVRVGPPVLPPPLLKRTSEVVRDFSSKHSKVAKNQQSTTQGRSGRTLVPLRFCISTSVVPFHIRQKGQNRCQLMSNSEKKCVRE